MISLEQWRVSQQQVKKVVDVWTGVDGSVDKISNTVKKGSKSLKKYVKDATDTANALVKLEKDAKLAAKEQERISLSYKDQAEAQRQIRDDVNASIEDRIKANNKLQKILEKSQEGTRKTGSNTDKCC